MIIILVNNKVRYVKTPFSHDGASAIPEPATLFLYGDGADWAGSFWAEEVF